MCVAVDERNDNKFFFPPKSSSTRLDLAEDLKGAPLCRKLFEWKNHHRPCKNSKSKQDSHSTIPIPPSYRDSITSHSDSSTDSSRQDLQKALRAYDQQQFILAQSYYRISASQGNNLAWHNLGVMFLHGQGIAADYTQAHSCFMRAASNGIAASMSQLGYMNLYGRGIPQNFAQARAWFVRAISSGEDAYAYYSLALIYFSGIGVSTDLKLGKKYLIFSAERGFAPAMYNLAVQYTIGQEPFSYNPEFAAQLYRRILATDRQHGEATNNLGVIYMQQYNDSPEKSQTALNLFRQAAKQGVPAAIFNLGIVYNYGVGVNANANQAAKFYTWAQNSGLVAVNRTQSTTTVLSEKPSKHLPPSCKSKYPSLDVLQNSDINLARTTRA